MRIAGWLVVAAPVPLVCIAGWFALCALLGG